MKTILVPTDFSANADHALKFAVVLAKKSKAGILLLHASHILVVSSDIPASYPYAQVSSEDLEAAEKKLKAMQQKLIKSGIVKCEYLLTQNFAIDAILSAIKKKKADLVVMGTKGASGLKGVFIGSNASAVVEKADCPVITVPEKAVFSGLKEVVYATDYRINDLPSLKLFIQLVKAFNPEISIVHVSGGDFIPSSENELLKEFIKRVGSKTGYKKMNYRIIYGKNVEKKLEEYAKGRKADLMVMSTHHRNLVDKLFRKSVTRKMTFHATIPLLAFHYRKDPIIFT